MKYLKIDDNKGHFTTDGSSWLPIDQIDKNQLLKLLDFALEEDFEMDEFSEKDLANQAHQIYEKLTELRENRTRFKDESEALYKTAIEKYSQ